MHNNAKKKTFLVLGELRKSIDDMQQKLLIGVYMSQNKDVHGSVRQMMASLTMVIIERMLSSCLVR